MIYRSYLYQWKWHYILCRKLSIQMDSCKIRSIEMSIKKYHLLWLVIPRPIKLALLLFWYSILLYCSAYAINRCNPSSDTDWCSAFRLVNMYFFYNPLFALFIYSTSKVFIESRWFSLVMVLSDHQISDGIIIT